MGNFQPTLTQPVVVTSYSYDAGNQITSIAYASGARTTYSYDLAGNLHTQQTGSAYTTYTWDYGNRLVAAATPSNGILTNMYDASGLRQAYATSFTGAVTQTYDAMTMNLLRQDSAKGPSGTSETDRFLYTPDTFGSPIAQLSLPAGGSVTQSYALSDLTHNIAVTAVGGGDYSGPVAYAGFGLPVPGATGASPANPTPLSWGGEAGYFYDLVTGLYNAKHRWIDPVTGRFISVDPIGFWRGELAVRYKYVENSPVLLVDPLGKYPLNLSQTNMSSPGPVATCSPTGFPTDNNGVRIKNPSPCMLAACQAFVGMTNYIADIASQLCGGVDEGPSGIARCFHTQTCFGNRGDDCDVDPPATAPDPKGIIPNCYVDDTGGALKHACCQRCLQCVCIYFTTPSLLLAENWLLRAFAACEADKALPSTPNIYDSCLFGSAHWFF